MRAIIAISTDPNDDGGDGAQESPSQEAAQCWCGRCNDVLRTRGVRHTRHQLLKDEWSREPNMDGNDCFGFASKIDPRNKATCQDHRNSDCPIKCVLGVGGELRRLPQVPPVQQFSKHPACATCSENCVSPIDSHVRAFRVQGWMATTSIAGNSRVWILPILPRFHTDLIRRSTSLKIKAISPLQFQKQLRLHVAHQKMLTGEQDAATAAFEVGYESPSQFNREYKRFFGQPPMRDIQALRASV